MTWGPCRVILAFDATEEFGVKDYRERKQTYSVSICQVVSYVKLLIESTMNPESSRELISKKILC